ncbi:universal stress protein [Kineosporia sp. NBRC 101731]|uniref:universal stress protein n=1 Tax=Kineosporia sp. NBRC 101731 TaxID=3032199 RepID=UPI0024A3C6A0|nr:universal stress protein [Kineosporia sp. NBRC 101731]GLY29217.1 universal stress protein [Kineosporia sp. NBRC 101731]
MTFKTRKTVVGYDGSRSAQAALDWAAVDAAERGSELLVLHVAEFGPAEHDGGSTPEPLGRASTTLLEDGLARVRRLAPDLPVTLETSLAGISRSLVTASCTAEMVVLGVPEHRTVEGQVLGNTTAAVVARAHCPVVVVSPGAGVARGRCVTVGYDGSAGAERALSFAAERAGRQDVPLVVTVAYEDAQGTQDTQGTQAATRLGELAVTWVHRCFPGVQARYELVEGTAVPVLSDASHGCGIVVVGNRGRGLTADLLTGSVGNGLITRSHSPLAVVH